MEKSEIKERLKSFVRDPLYLRLIEAKTAREYTEAKETVLSIRGVSSFKMFMGLIKAGRELQQNKEMGK